MSQPCTVKCEKLIVYQVVVHLENDRPRLVLVT